jgi:hypothetical protein
LHAVADMDRTHVVAVLGRLTQLEVDRLLSLEAAIERVHDREARARLKDFRAAHAAHLADLDDAMHAHMAQAPDQETMRGLALEARIAAAARVGDAGVLGAVAESERELMEAYAEAAADEGLGESLRGQLAEKLDDERQHGAWLDQALAAYS